MERLKRRVRLWTPRVLAVALLALPCAALNLQDHGVVLDDSILVKNGLVFVNAVINGRGPFRMLIDTGTTTSLLDPDTALQVGLTYDHRVILNSLGSERPLSATSTAEVQVGSAKETGLEIVATSIAQLRTIDRRAHGVLGQNFLSRSPYLIDYARKKLWLGEDAIRRADELPFVLSAPLSNGRTVLPVTLQAGHPSWHLTLDSGASNLLVKCSKGCPAILDSRIGERVITLMGERPVQSGTLVQIEVAGARISQVHALLVSAELSDGQDDGVIPSQWFSAVYVDGNSGLVRLAQRR
jgi:hypothetical protein